MVTPYAALITPTIHATTLIITAVSAFYVYRQRGTSYAYVKSILLLVYLLFGVVIISEFARVSYSIVLARAPGPLFMRLYTEGGITLILFDVWLLTVAAAAIYFRPSGDLRGIFSEILKNPRHRVAFLALSAYIIAADTFLLTTHPYQIRPDLKNLWGVTVVSSSLSQDYLAILLIVLLAFIAYPSYLIFTASRRFAEPSIRRALVLLPVCWSAIGLDLVMFNGYLWLVGIDANDAGYLVAGTVFSITAIVFRRASVLASFFDVKPTLEGPSEYPFSTRLGVGKRFLARRNILLEINPATDYERVIIDFAKEVISTKHILFTFTSRGSPIYRVLSETHDVIGTLRFFILTDKVSYPKPTEGQLNEIMVPQHDNSILLDVLDKTLKSTPDTPIAILFDSITDMTLSIGLEKTYNFLKQANEIVNDPRATSLFIINEPAHDDKTKTLIRSLFPNHLSYTAAGLKATKQV